MTPTVAERILDGAGRLYVRQGIAATDMAEIAAEAGCSRATLYRYFENRNALQLAFARREAQRLALQIAKHIAQVDPAERMVEATIAGLRAVRSHALLSHWVAEAESVAIADIVGSAELLDVLAQVLVGDADDPDVLATTRWLVRIAVSLFFFPGENEDDEREMLRRFVLPALTARQPARNLAV